MCTCVSFLWPILLVVQMRKAWGKGVRVGLELRPPLLLLRPQCPVSVSEPRCQQLRGLSEDSQLRNVLSRLHIAKRPWGTFPRESWASIPRELLLQEKGCEI